MDSKCFLNCAMLTDFYELTMMQGYFLQKHNPLAAFENNITLLRAKRTLRHIRFRIRFEIGPVSVPLPKQVVISRVQFHY